MAIWIAICAAAAPAFMLVASWGFPALRGWIEGAALACAFLFAVLTATYVVSVLDRGVMPVQDLRPLLSNRWWQASAAYLAIYGIYKLALGWLQLFRE
ncbi:hypothetical protein SD70_24425 [Gordoniibacillus kamchatkensis]|uniref:Uncharacterized protein n=1 Tax=Gordoniibacillus kamchatkensis TaxID=1590651 RepID=A0ABR5ACH8_9BACL|nr:hypothetical protein [Paenibacillus sp. VKM B-2647]KIL38754.1 hypothetical protein SD70_24425 [Paenibacillus sp. VKM B-2647]